MPTNSASTLTASLTLPASVRLAIMATGGAMLALCLYAIGRGLLGLTPDLPHLRNAAVVVHVATVLPAIPLGAWILLTRKGDRRHKLLGKVWLGLMLATATSAIFIQTGGQFSWIHLFVPLTFHAAWKTVATARRGDIEAHKRHLVFTYLAALMIPGTVAFLIEGRLMNVLAFG